MRFSTAVYSLNPALEKSFVPTLPELTKKTQRNCHINQVIECSCSVTLVFCNLVDESHSYASMAEAIAAFCLIHS